jgi:hypothetical protein
MFLCLDASTLRRYNPFVFAGVVKW